MTLIEEEVDRYNNNTSVVKRNEPYMHFLKKNDSETENVNFHPSIEENHDIFNSLNRHNNRDPPMAQELENISNNNGVPALEEEEDYNDSYDMYDQQRIPEIENNFSEYFQMEKT